MTRTPDELLKAVDAAIARGDRKAAIGQLGDYQQPAVNHFNPLERQQERVPHAANTL